MRNYIIFYAAIIVFVVGGIKGTSYIIAKENQEELDKINFHQNVTNLLVHGGEVSPAETLNKNIVIYSGVTYDNRTKADILRLNELKTKYAGNTALYLYARTSGKPHMDNFLKKKKLEPGFKIIYKPRELSSYMQSLNHYFYTKEELDSIQMRSTVVLVISSTGKIKLYKLGYNKDLMSQIEAALK